MIGGDNEVWQFDGVTFVHSFDRQSTATRFCIRKGQSLIDRYVDLLPSFRDGRIVELGIADGGSTALISILGNPAKLVACELSTDAPAGLAAFIAGRQLGDRVKPYYGVDQSDRSRLTDLVDAEFGATPIDLVIDDASHLYEQTRASFEVLFPRLRPGGLFIIEDWATQLLHALGLRLAVEDMNVEQHDEMKERLREAMLAGHRPAPPLSRLGTELALAAAETPDAVPKVTVDHHWVVVERGPAPLDRERFTIDDLYTDYFGWFRQ